MCKCCGDRKVEIGIEIVEQLDYVPASFKVIEHATHKFACRPCQEGVVEGKRPKQIHNGGKPGERLIAQIATAKYADHLPLYRQEQIYDREGVNVARSSMGRWLDQSAQAAKPVYERMQELILQSRVLQIDESPIKFIDKGRAVKKIKQGYAWSYYGDEEHPYTIYDLQPDRCAQRAKDFLGSYSNFICTDGYGGYNWYPEELSSNCRVHDRRGYEKALKYDKNKAGAMIALYAKLYEVESRAKGLSHAEIAAIRQKESVPILEQMKGRITQWQLTTPPKSTLGMAVNYSLTRWEKLCRFVDHGFLPIDTNLVENSIRPVSLGRKNWLHVGGEDALETASIHASLVNTCKRLGLNPFLYLRDIFIRLGREDVCIDDLLPDRWQLQNSIDQERENAESKAVKVEGSAPL